MVVLYLHMQAAALASHFQPPHSESKPPPSTGGDGKKEQQEKEDKETPEVNEEQLRTTQQQQEEEEERSKRLTGATPPAAQPPAAGGDGQEQQPKKTGDKEDDQQQEHQQQNKEEKKPQEEPAEQPTPPPVEQFAIGADDAEFHTNARLLCEYREMLLATHKTIVSNDAIVKGSIEEWSVYESHHIADESAMQPLGSTTPKADGGVFDPALPSCQRQQLAMLGVKGVAIAAFGSSRRGQEPRAMIEKGLLKTPEGDEEFSWNNVLLDYRYDKTDESKKVTGVIILVTNAKTLSSFVSAGGTGGMKSQDGTDRKYNRTKDKMLQVLKEYKFIPFFVRPHPDKFLVAPLPGFPFREELVCSSYLNARSWLVLPANQVITKLEPLLKSLGAPFVGNVFSRIPRDGGVEEWESFYKTRASAEVSSLYKALCCVYIRIPRTSARLTPPACPPRLCCSSPSASRCSAPDRNTSPGCRPSKAGCRRSTTRAPPAWS